MLKILKIVPLHKIIFELHNKERSEFMSDTNVSVIEQFILDAWDKGLSGANVLNYVCAESSLSASIVEPVLDDLIERMAE